MFTRRLAIAFALAIALLFQARIARAISPTCSGSAYYVDAINGNDNNSGLSGAPWQTLAKVNSATLAAGSVVYFHEGQYWEGDLTPQAGTSGCPIAYTDYAAPGDWSASHSFAQSTVIIPSANNAGGYAYEVTIAGTSNTSEPTWPQTVGNTVTDSGVTWVNIGTDVLPEILGAHRIPVTTAWTSDGSGVYSAAWGSSTGPAEFVWVGAPPAGGWSGSLVNGGATTTPAAGDWGFSGTTLYVHLSSGANPSGTVVDGDVSTYTFGAQAESNCGQYVTLDHLQFARHHTSEIAFKAGASCAMNGVIISNNEAYQSGINQCATLCTTATDPGNYENALEFDADNDRGAYSVQITNNKVSYCGQHGNCIMVTSDSGSPVVSGNEVQQWAHNGIDFKKDGTGTVQSNFVHNDPSGGYACFYTENSDSNSNPETMTWKQNVCSHANTCLQASSGSTGAGGNITGTFVNNDCDNVSQYLDTESNYSGQTVATTLQNNWTGTNAVNEPASTGTVTLTLGYNAFAGADTGVSGTGDLTSVSPGFVDGTGSFSAITDWELTSTSPLRGAANNAYLIGADIGAWQYAGAGTNYYVNNVSACSDSNAGTSTTAPWCTVAHVVSKASTFKGGDQVLFARGGVWYEQANLSGFHGSVGNPITVGAYTPAATGGPISFIGRTQANVNTNLTSVTISTPSGIAAGDMMLVMVDSYNAQAPAPSGWTLLGTVESYFADFGQLYEKTYATADGTSYTFGATSGQTSTNSYGYPLAVMRVYRNVAAIDEHSGSASGQLKPTGFSAPAIGATVKASEWYIGFWATDGAAVTGPSDLGDATANSTQWYSFDGDKIISAAGTTPSTESATTAPTTGNWMSFAITLEASSATSSTAAPVIDGGNTRAYGFYAIGNGAVSYLTLNGFEVRYATEYGVTFQTGGGVSDPGITVENFYIHNTGPGASNGDVEGCDPGYASTVNREGTACSPATIYANQLDFEDSGPASGGDGVHFIDNTVNHCGGHNCLEVHDDAGAVQVIGNRVGPGCVHGCIDLKGAGTESLHAIVDDNIVQCGISVGECGNAGGVNYAGSTNGVSTFTPDYYFETLYNHNSGVTWTRNIAYDGFEGFQNENNCDGTSSTNCVTQQWYWNNTIYLTSATGIAWESEDPYAQIDVRNTIIDAPSLNAAFKYNINYWDFNDYLVSTLTVAANEGSHNISSNPLFAGASSANFSLSVGSPCIDAGYPGLVAGYDDIGAIEYGGAGAGGGLGGFLLW